MNHINVNKYSVLFFFLLSVTSLLSANGQNDDYDSWGHSRGFGHMGSGSGHMGQGAYSNGPGMMGNGYYRNQGISSGERLTHDEIDNILGTYVKGAFGKDYYIEEIMEFESNYYAQVGKEGEDNLAVELLIDPYTGQVFPEHGPNMMWNQSYGHMGRRFWGNGKVKISSDESVKIAQEFLDYHDTGFIADDHAATFDGYYTLHTMKDGEITGMLSVNGVNGEVWFHDWHGDFIGMDESESHDD